MTTLAIVLAVTIAMFAFPGILVTIRNWRIDRARRAFEKDVMAKRGVKRPGT